METTNDYDPLRHLTGPQVIAIGELMSGGDHQQAADAAGVHRVTVSKWVNHHPEFQAELNRRRHGLLDQRADRVRRMDELVLQQLQERIEEGDPDAMNTWIKARQLGKINPGGIGPLSSKTIIEEEVDRRARVADSQAFDDMSVVPGSRSRWEVRQALESELTEFLGEDD